MSAFAQPDEPDSDRESLDSKGHVVARLLQRMREYRTPLTPEELEQIRKFWADERTPPRHGLSIAEVTIRKTVRKSPGSVVVRLTNDRGTLKINHQGIDLEGAAEGDDVAIRASLEMFKKQWPRSVVGLKGEEDFELRTWAQAQLLGIRVRRFKPTAEQRNRLVARAIIQVVPRQRDQARALTRQEQEVEEAERVSLEAKVKPWYLAKLEGRKFKGPVPSAEELARVRVRFGPLSDWRPRPRARPAATVQRALTQ